MNTYKVKVGTLNLTEARDVNLPQEHAAWFETVHIEPGVYDVYAYLPQEYGGTRQRIHEIAAQCEGTTTSCYYGGSSRDVERVGKRTTAYVRLPTYGMVGEINALLAQTTLCGALVRREWDPGDHGQRATKAGRMWRFTWNPDAKLKVDEGQPTHSGATITASIVAEGRDGR